MGKPINHLKLLSLIHRFEGNDRDLEQVLDVSRATVWRIKNGKISKINKYIEILEGVLGDSHSSPIDCVFEDLKLWSSSSKELREILISLHTVLQESATRSE